MVLGNFEVNAASSHSYKMEWKVMWKERTAKCQWYGLSSKRLTGYFMYCRQKHRPLKAKSSLESRKISIVNLPLHLWQLTKWLLWHYSQNQRYLIHSYQWEILPIYSDLLLVPLLFNWYFLSHFPVSCNTLQYCCVIQE